MSAAVFILLLVTGANVSVQVGVFDRCAGVVACGGEEGAWRVRWTNDRNEYSKRLGPAPIEDRASSLGYCWQKIEEDV